MNHLCYIFRSDTVFRLSYHQENQTTLTVDCQNANMALYDLEAKEMNCIGNPKCTLDPWCIVVYRKL